MTTSSVRFLYDEGLQQNANADCENYWYAYVQDVADQMGLTADALRRDELTAEGLADTRALILPDLPEGYFSEGQRQTLEAWVAQGGLLVGLATEGLDELFGVSHAGLIEQPGDPYSYSATLRLTDEELARPLYNEETQDASILIVSAVRRVVTSGRELAHLYGVDGEDLEASAATLVEHGKGLACYFGFNLCQTVWTLHQGRPVYTDRDGDGYYRVSDAIIIRPFRIDVPYADLLVFLLRNVIALADVYFIHPLPPTEDGTVPDALFYWGGDDEAAEGTQVPASDWMRGQGLPYHFNIMPRPDGTFSVTKEQFDHIQANGHDTSLHFNYIQAHEHPYAFTREDIQQQVGWYEEAFGQTPVCTVFHWTLWHSWSEPAEWMAECGIQADNSRIHTGSPPLNPTNLVGYSFGTAFPFWYRSDWRSENRRVDFISEQIAAYECGYMAGKGTEFSQLHRAIRDAAYWHLTTDFFFHPINVANYPECREAVVECLRYTRELGLDVVHMGNDELNDWWRARSATRIEQTARGPRADCPWPGGCIVMRRDERGVEELGGKWRYDIVKP